jgi:cysteinyl-tRNA synthetase
VLHDRAADPAAPLSPTGRSLHDRFVAAIDDDIDVPAALALLREVLRTDLDDDERRWLVLDADLVLGLDLHRVWDRSAVDDSSEVPEAISRLVAARSVARQQRDFERSDAIRDQLDDLGWTVVDGPDGSLVHRREQA